MMKLFEMVAGGGLLTKELVWTAGVPVAPVTLTFRLQRGPGGYSKWVSFGGQVFVRFGKQIAKREEAPKGATVTELEASIAEVVSPFAMTDEDRKKLPF